MKDLKVKERDDVDSVGQAEVLYENMGYIFVEDASGRLLPS